MHISQSSVCADTLPCGVIELNQNRQILYCNNYAANKLLRKSEQITGLPIDDLATAASKIFIDSYVYPQLLENSKAEEVHLNFRLPDGVCIPVVANIAIDGNLHTTWSFMVCENRDKLYEELLSARDTLHLQKNGLQEHNEKIQYERDDLKIFCRSLSHDFTAPIRRIQMLVSYALEDLKSKDLPVDEEISMLEHSIRNAAALNLLIRGLVEYLTTGIHVQLDEVVSLDEVVASAIVLSESDSERELPIVVDQLPTVIGNAAQLQIVFKNLIGNATKYTQSISKIVISSQPSNRPGYCNIAIKDNGIGMSEEYLNKIFEPFSRLHNDDDYSGSGLGLCIVKKLVCNHDGDVSVQSTLGEGSTFYVELPLAHK